MTRVFQRALVATGYLSPDGMAAQGLHRREDTTLPRFRPILTNERIGLGADAVFLAHDVPVSIFKDSGEVEPAEEQIKTWHEAAWNIGVAPLLWIVTPTEIHLYDCYSSPTASRGEKGGPSKPLQSFRLAAEEALRALDSMCGRLATETGAFWSSRIGSKIDRRNRVDRQLLAEIRALEDELTVLPPARGRRHPDGTSEVRQARDFAQRLIGRCIFTWYLLDREIAQRFLPRTLQTSLENIFSTTESAFALFDWLRQTFDGDLFPMNDPGAERDRLGEKHLSLLRQFIEGWSLVEGQRGQGRLFRFRFDAIPVDLISSIYQQFARSSAADQARLQGVALYPS